MKMEASRIDKDLLPDAAIEIAPDANRSRAKPASATVQADARFLEG